MRSQKVRIASVFVSLAAVLALTGLIAPGALGYEGSLNLAFVNQPKDAVKDATITSDPFVPGGAPVQVLVQSYEQGVPNVDVTLGFAEGSAIGTIHGNTATTGAHGIATFYHLTIGDENEPMFTDYQLVPTAHDSPPVEASDPFDIWGAGCKAPCSVGLRDNLDSYTSSQTGLLSASSLPHGSLPIVCAGQTLIFAQDVFVHATDDATGKVFLSSHITRANMKAAANNGQVFVNWCVGLKPDQEQLWIHNGASYSPQDMNGEGTPGGILLVGIAPKCPKTAPKTFAPCITKQKGDGNGGNITEGWLPGGDPPRRT